MTKQVRQAPPPSVFGSGGRDRWFKYLFSDNGDGDGMSEAIQGDFFKDLQRHQEQERLRKMGYWPSPPPPPEWPGKWCVAGKLFTTREAAIGYAQEFKNEHGHVPTIEPWSEEDEQKVREQMGQVNNNPRPRKPRGAAPKAQVPQPPRSGAEYGYPLSIATSVSQPRSTVVSVSQPMTNNDLAKAMTDPIRRAVQGVQGYSDAYGPDKPYEPAKAQKHTSEPLTPDPVLWALPSGREDRPWIIPEIEDTLQWAESVEKHDVLIANTTMPGTIDMRSFSSLTKRLKDKAWSAFKRTGMFLGLGLVWMGFSAIIDRRIPGEADEILTVLGLIAILYAVARHGYSMIRWFHLSDKAVRSYTSLNECRSALLDAIDQAITYRSSLKSDQMGNDSDKELLDWKAYEKLATQKDIKIADVVRLSKTLSREIGGLSLAQIVEQYKLSMPAAQVYRDLADMHISLEGAEMGLEIPEMRLEPEPKIEKPYTKNPSKEGQKDERHNLRIS